MTEKKYNLTIAFSLVTSLFFLWGVSYGLLDTMNKNFQDQLGINKANSGLLQFAYFGAYFVVALPAGWIMAKAGYKTGIIIGLSLFAAGSLLFIPATSLHQFWFFLLSFFILACGLGFLETAANPYITLLGNPKTADARINFSQSFNGLGQAVGPFLGGFFILGIEKVEGANHLAQNMAGVRMVYVGIAIILILIIIAFLLTKMPDKRAAEENKEATNNSSAKNPLSSPAFKKGLLAQFLYVGAQVTAAAFFINYATSHWSGLSSEHAAYLLSASLTSFMIGRFVSTGIMLKFSAEKIMGVYAVVNTFLLILVCFGIEKISVIALMASFFFMSIMFPSIFSLSIRELDSNTAKIGSSYLIMSIVGGALYPSVQGWIADITGSIALSYVLPLTSYLYVIWFSFTYKRS